MRQGRIETSRNDCRIEPFNEHRRLPSDVGNLLRKWSPSFQPVSRGIGFQPVEWESGAEWWLVIG